MKLGREFLGTEYGGWAVCLDKLNAESVVYSFGIGHDASFDLELIRKVGCKVNAFDPTPDLKVWIDQQNYTDKFIFHHYGIAEFDGIANIRSQSTEMETSGTILGREDLPVETVGTPIHVKRLESIKRELGHNQIDLLKMDVEGAEFSVIHDVLDSGIRPKQWLIEFHRYVTNGSERERAAFSALQAAGYKLFDISERDTEFGFYLCP